MVTAATLLATQKGPIIGSFDENAHLGKGRSIHAAGQMEWFNCKVDERSKVVGGAQRIETSDGYVIPLSIGYSPHLTPGMLQSWIIALHLLYLKKLTKKLMILYFKIQFLMNLENSNIGWYNN